MKTLLASAGAAVLSVALAAAPARGADAPQRVVAVGGAVTEIVHALGAMDRLVAVDSTSTYPAAADELPDVGYMRQLAAEPIIALEPDLVLAAADAGPPIVFEQLREAGIDVVRAPDEPTPGGVLEKVRVVSGALGAADRGRELTARLEAGFDDLARRLEAVAERPRVLTLISAGPGNLMAAGRETSAAGIVRLAGGRNAVTAYSGFRPLAPEAIVAAAPDWIVLTAGAQDALGGLEGVRGHAALGQTPAARDGRVVAMDGLLLLGFGPRTPRAAARLLERLHPGSSAVRD